MTIYERKSTFIFKFNRRCKTFLSHLFKSAVFLSLHLVTLIHHPHLAGTRPAVAAAIIEVTTPVAFQIVGKSKAGQLARQRKKKKKTLPNSFLPPKSLSRPSLTVSIFFSLLHHSPWRQATGLSVASTPENH